MRRAWRFIALPAVVALVAAACGGQKAQAPGGGGQAPKKVGLVYDIGGRGDKSFNDAAARGLDQAKRQFGSRIQVKELEPSAGGENREELLRLLAQQGYGLNIGVGFLFAESVCKVGLQYPNIKFADVDGFIDHTTCDGAKDLTTSSNVTSLLFAEEQGSFLVGAAAALKSSANHIGFIGGVEVDLIKKFQAGFEAGARQIKPDIKIDVAYITQPPDFSGFNDPAKAKEIALGMYQNGADVIYHAAGGSGAGLFEAAKEYSTANNTHVWAIGVDSDQYLTAPPDEQPYILTSMLKRVDVAVFETIKDYVNGRFRGGYRVFDLKANGVGYATSGGFIDDVKSQLEDLKQKIINGEIKVPTTPTD